MSVKTMATVLAGGGLFLTLFSGCRSAMPTPSVQQMPTRAVRAQTQLAAQPLSAKYALERAERYALAWSPEATLTHVFGQHITAQGLPHKTRGSWTFSFVDYDAPHKGFQVHMQSGQADQKMALPARRLPRQEPLEIRAWNLDSNRLITQAKTLFPNLSTPLPDLELTASDRRLVWSLGQQQLVDAMNGRRFTPHEVLRNP